eukprot:1460457-Rhodomonas_salina.1
MPELAAIMDKALRLLKQLNNAEKTGILSKKEAREPKKQMQAVIADIDLLVKCYQTDAEFARLCRLVDQMALPPSDEKA